MPHLDNIENIRNKIFTASAGNFDEMALDIFRYQGEHVDLYCKYLEYLNINPSSVKKVEEIPFMPVEFFKQDKILPENIQEELYFESSGTTGMDLSRHYIRDSGIYMESIRKGFELVYGQPEDYVFLCLLPSYAEREHSSLVYMMDYLIKLGGNGDSGWYLYNHEDLYSKILYLQKEKKKIFLIGVTFALIDFAEQYSPDLSDTIVMETGGMKGRRKEMIREEVHDFLKQNLNLQSVHSEYGMTELLSQFYSIGNGIFEIPAWMRILIRDTNDPFSYLPIGQTGGINIIDLANIYSCSFIEVKDLGKKLDDTHFEVLGRFDNSDIRGCSLMYS